MKSKLLNGNGYLKVDAATAAPRATSPPIAQNPANNIKFSWGFRNFRNCYWAFEYFWHHLPKNKQWTCLDLLSGKVQVWKQSSGISCWVGKLQPVGVHAESTLRCNGQRHIWMRKDHKGPEKDMILWKKRLRCIQCILLIITVSIVGRVINHWEISTNVDIQK